MLTFKYEARDPKTGEKINAEVQADSEQSAAKLIKDSGYSPISIKPVTASTGPLARFKDRIGSKDKVLFSRQLSTLINAGLPLVQSLRNVSGQTQNKALQVIIGKIITDVEAGSSFSAALGKFPAVFNEVFVNLVAAGEASGTLDTALERIANQQEKDAEIVSKIRGAMAYPAIVILVMIGVVGFMLLTVMPQVENIYKDLPGGAQLPLVTRILLAVSGFATTYWWAVLIMLALGIFFTTRWARTLGGKSAIDKAKMKAPIFGPLFMKVYMARFSRTGTTLVASGVPLIQMLEIVARAISNVHVENAIKSAIEKVKGGKSLSDSLKGDPNFLTLVPDMIHIGEESGSLEDMLAKTAEYYEKEVDNQIRTISTIIEPVLMVLLGIIAFTIVAAVLLPVYGLVNQTNIV